MHPLWGFGFFMLVNRAVQAEQPGSSATTRAGVSARLFAKGVAALAVVGVFSYSLYLTHELVIMQSWSFTIKELPPIVNTLADRRAGDDCFCLVVLQILREAVHEESTAASERD